MYFVCIKRLGELYRRNESLARCTKWPPTPPNDSIYMYINKKKGKIERFRGWWRIVMLHSPNVCDCRTPVLLSRYTYTPEIISVFLHIDYSANLRGEWRGGRVVTTREKVYIRCSPSTFFPVHIPFYFFFLF